MKNAATLVGLTLVVLCLPACARRGAVEPPALRAAIEERVRTLLTAYAANDQDAVVGLLDPAGFVVLGSDVSEVVRTPAELRQLMTDDFRLWGSAAFGPIQDLDVRGDEHFASAVFHVPFSAAGGPSILVRFSTVWRRVDGEWRLAQSANTVPTTNSSARELTD